MSEVWNKIYESDNVTIAKSNDPNNKIFSKTFTVAGEKLPVELIARSDINKTNIYGPDFSSTGAHIMLKRPFLRVMLLII